MFDTSFSLKILQDSSIVESHAGGMAWNNTLLKQVYGKKNKAWIHRKPKTQTSFPEYTVGPS